MLNMKGRGEMKFLRPNKDVRDDKVVKTVLTKWAFTAVPLEVIAAGFIGQMALFYSKDDDLKIGDLEYLPVSRHVSNVEANIGGIVVERSIVKKVRITPRPGRVADVTLEVVGDIVAGLDDLHGMLKTTVDVELAEREFEVAAEDGDEERAAA